jgi:hypothetical protein
MMFMPKAPDRIDRLRIASPCPASWEKMTGDDRVRFCDQCNLHVYNISEMTRKQAEALIAKTEGRICAKLHRRADGTVLTKDCPVGLRAIRRRVSRVAGATVTAIFSFCMSVLGQQPSQEDKSRPDGTKISVEQTSSGQSQDSRSKLTGVVKDLNGAVVVGAKVILIQQSTGKKTETVSNDEGIYTFPMLERGAYTITVEAVGFQPTTVTDIDVPPGLNVRAEVMVGLATVMEVTVGILLEDPLFIDTTSSANKTVFTHKQITRLPF